MASKGILPAGLLLLLAVGITYSNHFQNGFHFDDMHTVVDNPYIRSLKNAGRFFTDPSTFSIRPTLRTYRPIVTLSLALDYWRGAGLEPFYFHLDAFVWYLVQLALMLALFRHILRLASQEPWTDWAALFAVALYGLHPAMAETVNYVIQRGDLYSTMLVLAALTVYALAPRLRRFGIYLLPLALAMLAKQPAAIFPAILFAYVVLFEERRVGKALLRCVPAAIVVAAMLGLQILMVPATYVPSTMPYALYVATQPWVALHYFLMFFAPVGLAMVSDQMPVPTIFSVDGLGGSLFILALAGAILAAARRENLRPAAFGLAWFLLALLPTSLYRLSELENDHRMFFPFVGLALAVSWCAALLVAKTRLPRPGLAGALCGPPGILAALILAACAWGAHQRNEVWRDEGTLWSDAAKKSPRSGSALMGYGRALLADSQPAGALVYLQRALAYSPNDFTLEENLGNAYAKLRMDDDAEEHFRRAMRLAPGEANPPYYYGWWLRSKGRLHEALAQFQTSAGRNRDFLSPQYALMQAYWDAGMQQEAKAVATAALKINPGDATALRFLDGDAAVDRLPDPLADAEASVKEAPTAGNYLKLSGAYGRVGRFRDCIQAAEQALKLRPDSAGAYVNIAGAQTELGEWDAAIEADNQALRLKPGFGPAQRNLAIAQQRKKLAASKKR